MAKAVGVTRYVIPEVSAEWADSAFFVAGELLAKDFTVCEDRLPHVSLAVVHGDRCNSEK